MKRSAILLIGLAAILFSCTPGKDELLMRTWQMDDKKAEILLRFGEGGKFSLQSENFDGTYTTDHGRWKFIEAREAIAIHLKGEEKTFMIEKLTDKRLVLLPRGEKLKLSFSARPE